MQDADSSGRLREVKLPVEEFNFVHGLLHLRFGRQSAGVTGMRIIQE
jgi:hypothetical protein